MRVPWLAIYSQSNAEKEVAKDLSKFCNTFYPFLRETKRVKRMGRTKITTTERAYFPRYLFAQLHPHYAHDIKDVRGVCAIVSRLGEPLCVPHGVVDAIRSLGDEHGCVEDNDFTRPLALTFKGKVGDQIKINWPDRIFDGFIACLSSLKRLKSHGEVGVFLQLFGSEREVNIPIGMVRLYDSGLLGAATS